MEKVMSSRLSAKGLSLIGLLLLTCLSLPTVYAQEEDDLAIIEALKNLNIDALGEVEIRLDDAFDVFDGLIQAKKVSIATGKKQFADRAPSVTTVMTAQDIEVMGARDLDEVLRAVPGLYVSYNYLGNPIYTMRGISTTTNPEVLILVNGFRLNNSQEGSKSTLWSGMPTNNISRIEIIRGPGSAVYGADAFSGVINIITKQANEINGTEAGVRFGSFDTQDAWVIHGDKWAGFDVAASIQYNKTNGHGEIVESDLQTISDNINDTSFSNAPGPYSAEVRSFDFGLDISRGDWQLRSHYHEGRDIGAGLGVNEALDASSPGNSDRFSTDLTYRNSNLTENWDVNAALSYQRTRVATRYILLPPGVAGFTEGFIGMPSVAEQHARVNLSGFYSGFNKHLIRVGVGYVYDDQYKIQHSNNFRGLGFEELTDTPRAFAPEVARSSWFGFIQDSWAFASNWELTSGVRYDHYSDFGSTTNPRIGIVWETTSNLTTKFLYGRAFRAPAFNELFVTNNPVQLGNPDLDPEIINTYELAFDYRAMPNLNLALNLFSYDIDDKIIYVPNVDGQTNIAENAGKWSGQGFEFEARWKTSAKSSLLFNYAFQDSEDSDSDNDLGNAPSHQGYLRVDWLLRPNWYLDAQVNMAADWSRQFRDPRDKIDDYATFDLTLRYKDIKAGGANIALGVRNLLDEDVRSPSFGPNANGIINVPYDIPQAGRSYFLEIRYLFD